jgi:hypothetical protein
VKRDLDKARRDTQRMAAEIKDLEFDLVVAHAPHTSAAPEDDTGAPGGAHPSTAPHPSPPGSPVRKAAAHVVQTVLATCPLTPPERSSATSLACLQTGTISPTTGYRGPASPPMSPGGYARPSSGCSSPTNSSYYDSYGRRVSTTEQLQMYGAFNCPAGSPPGSPIGRYQPSKGCVHQQGGGCSVCGWLARAMALQETLVQQQAAAAYQALCPRSPGGVYQKKSVTGGDGSASPTLRPPWRC